jgi:aspartate 4-decarboxylase
VRKGATGWRLGVIATHQQNILEQQLSDLSAEEKQRLELF